MIPKLIQIVLKLIFIVTFGVKIVEVGAELRVNVKNTQGYAFAEHGNDLGSSKDMKGNPTAAFRREGHGSSYGVGMKLG